MSETIWGVLLGGIFGFLGGLLGIIGNAIINSQKTKIKTS